MQAMMTMEHYLQKKNTKLIKRKFFLFGSKTDFMCLGRIRKDEIVSWLVLRRSVIVNVDTKIMLLMSLTPMRKEQGNWNAKDALARVLCMFGHREMVRILDFINVIHWRFSKWNHLKGPRQIKCGCKHDAEVHDPGRLNCLKCSCKKFHSSYRCSCGETHDQHKEGVLSNYPLASRNCRSEFLWTSSRLLSRQKKKE